VEKEDYHLVVFPPYESVEKMQSEIYNMYAAVDHLTSPRLLVDVSATRKKVPVLDLYELCIYMVGKFGPLYPRIAILASPEAVYPDRFGENVVRNRGLDLIRFVDSEQEALDWLRARKRPSPA
jgi:hypothetical protein